MIQQIGHSGRWGADLAPVRRSPLALARRPSVGGAFLGPLRLGVNGEPPAVPMLTEAQILDRGAQAIISSGQRLEQTLYRIYEQYKTYSNSSLLKSAAITLAGWAAPPVGLGLATLIQGNADRQAVVKIEAARHMADEWINGVKDEWMGDKGENLHARLIQLDDPRASDVERAFDQVVDARNFVASLVSEVQTLPTYQLNEGIRLFFSDTYNEVVKPTVELLLELGILLRQLLKGARDTAETVSRIPAILLLAGVVFGTWILFK